MILADEYCPVCGGGHSKQAKGGCVQCHGFGGLFVERCPLELVPPRSWTMLDAAELAAKGSWPVGGGWLDQSASCVEAIRLVWSEESHWKAKLSIPDG